VDLGLRDRVYVVTGGSSGIGLATATALLREGAKVAVCARDLERLTAAYAGKPQERVLLHACDVQRPDEVREFVDAAAARFGGLDGLVNNAGGSLMSRALDASQEQWREQLELKVFGLLHPVHATRRHLRASGAGAIVNVNAILARQPEGRLAVSAAARAAALNLSASLAEDLAPDGIRVNSVLLGLIDTGQWRRRYEQSHCGVDYETWSAEIAADRGIKLGRFGTADEVAFPILSLLSPRSSYITGATVDVGGGVGRYV
jgi:NAD(P)-dependent dehydrogenase (short-subunit alcohol dehydrogenase family)